MFLTENGLFHFVAYINTGSYGFDGFWAEADTWIRQKIEQKLRNQIVVDRLNRVDFYAIEEVQGDVVRKLQTMARRPEGSRFYVERIHCSPAGLAKWLDRLIGNCVIDYCRQFHGAKESLKMVSLGDEEFNAAVEPACNEKHGIDTLIWSHEIEKVRRCLNLLDEESRFWLTQVYFEDVSRHELARRLKISSATACRRVEAAEQEFLRLFLAA